MSVKKLTDKELTVFFVKDSCKILKDSQLLACANIQNGLYELNSAERALMSTEDTGCIHVWHNRLGHRDPNAIRALEQQLDDFQIKSCQVKQVCECCICSKVN